jgi:hypothetical protein
VLGPVKVVPPWTGPALQRNMAAIRKHGQARSAKSKCPRFQGNPARPPGAPGPGGPGRAPGGGAGFTEGGRWTGEGSRRRRPGVEGESRRWWAAAQARCLSVGDARRGPPPQRRSPAPAARRSPPPRILVTVPARAARPSSTRRASCRRESSLSRTLRPAALASLRFAPGRPLTANFPGKIRHLPGGRGRIDQPPERALAID